MSGLISDVAGAQVSAGFICSCLRTAARLAADVIKLIRTLVTAAHVARFDETTLRVGPAGQKKYVLGAFTEKYSLLFRGTRSLESFRDFGILPDFTGVVVSDRYQTYFHPGGTHRREPGTLRLIRDYQDAAEYLPRRHLATAGTAGTARADQRMARRPRAGPRRDPRRHGGPADLRVPPRGAGRAGQHPAHPRPQAFHCPASRPRPAGILPPPPRRRRAAVLPRHQVLAHEQHQRAGHSAVKTQQKISGRLTSDDATQDRLDIRSYIDTARKHGHDALTVLRSLMTGTPWRPPAPTAARHNQPPPRMTRRDITVRARGDCLRFAVALSGRDRQS